MDEKFFQLFERGVDRRNSECTKWDDREKIFGRADVIPFWVADMDFPAPEGVKQAIIKRAEHGVFGYRSSNRTADVQAVINWMQNRHHTHIEPEWVMFSPGVVESQRTAVIAFCKPGDKIALQPPVYGPFYDAIKRHGCEIYRNCLLQTEDGWKMDLNHLEDGFKQGVRMMLLCSPHNPVGRIWSEQELKDLSDLARRYNVVLVSDEIHSDFELPGHKHTSILNVHEDAICMISCTKTFGLASLGNSSVLIRNEDIRKQFAAELNRRGGSTNLFGAVAQRAAYETGGEWLSALNEYLDGTRMMVEDFLKKEIPELKPSRLEGSYLMWLDTRELGMEEKALSEFLVKEAGVGLYMGTHFGEEGRGFMRMNIATPRSNVAQGLENMAKALKKRKQA